MGYAITVERLDGARVRLTGDLGAQLRETLGAIPSFLFGSPGHTRLAAYVLAACDAPPLPLPPTLLQGYQTPAPRLGLEGSVVHPDDVDLFRP